VLWGARQFGGVLGLRSEGMGSRPNMGGLEEEDNIPVA